jgi:glucosamine-6-phosphate deaminase
MNLISTLKNSMVEDFFPIGWDLQKIDACCANEPNTILSRQQFWNEKFEPVSIKNVADFNVYLGHEIALTIKQAKDAGKELALILPVGPMGMYRWVVYFLKQWNVDAKHVYCFNMDEWSDEFGITLEQSDKGSFYHAMQDAFYLPLGELTVPEAQRNYATRENLPTYEEKIQAIKARGGELVVVYGIGRVFHIAFWEPHFAAEFESVELWKKQTHRLGAKLHPLTIEQNALTSFKSRTTLVPARANTIGPGLFLQADKAIGGADGVFGRGMQWQGVSLWVTLRYEPSIWVPSSFIPTLPGKLFFIEELAGPLIAETN